MVAKFVDGKPEYADIKKQQELLRVELGITE
jgi:hypothetical protein